MNVRKRGLALLMCICMIFTLLPFSALAADDDVVYGQYDKNGENWTSSSTATASQTHTDETTGANIEYSKEAKATNTPNVYDVTLTIKNTTTKVAPGASAVVLVIDQSTSMEWCANCSAHSSQGHRNQDHNFTTRLSAAKQAATNFVNSYKGETADAGRYLQIVTFDGYAYTKLSNWIDVSSSGKAAEAITAINNISTPSRGNGTNLEQGLTYAKNLITAAPDGIQSDKKFAVVLTDGEPNKYSRSSKEDQYVEYYTTAAATALKSSAAVYTVCFGAENTKVFNTTVGQYLSSTVASSSSNAYNANSQTELINAFNEIFKAIEKGITSGFTVADPMGKHAVLRNTTLTDCVIADNSFTWTPKNGTSVTNSDGSTTTTYTLTYQVKLDVDSIPADGTYPLNGVTTLTFGGTTLNFNVPGVKGEVPRYTVTYNKGANGSLENQDDNGNVVHNDVKKGKATPAAPAVTPDEGYWFTGWDKEIAKTVTADVTYTAQYAKKQVLTVTAKSAEVTYNGETQSVSGFEQLVFDGYTVSGLTASASGTDKGTYTTTIIGTAKVTDAQGINVTEQFTVNTVSGELKINPATVTLTSATDTKVYDGTPLTNNKVAVTGDGFVAGEVSDIKATGSVTYVSEGEVTNTITYTTSDSFKADNYNITKNEGKLSITAVETALVVTANDASKTYDGTALTDSGYTYTEGVLAEGDELVVEVEGSQTDAGSSANVVKSVKVMRGDVDVTANYNIGDPVDGKLTVAKRDVTLTSETASKPYDGTALTKPDVTVTGDGFVAGEVSDIKATGSVTYVSEGEVTNAITYTTSDSFKADNYNITKNEGKLSITAVETALVVTANDASKTYDGTALTDSGYTYTEGVLAEGDELVVEVEGSQTDAGSSANVVKSVKVMRGDVDVTACYTMGEHVNGTLTVNPKAVTFTGESDSKEYNGEEQEITGITVEGLLEGHEYSGLSYSAKGINVGEYVGEFSGDVVIKDAEGNDVTKNYAVTKTPSTLTITKIQAEITVVINGATDTVYYNGKEQSVTGYDWSSEAQFADKINVTLNEEGKDTAKGTRPDTYYMDLTEDNFTVTSDVYTHIKVVVNDGWLKINRRPVGPTPEKITVTITGNTDSKVYDGTEQNVNGYTWVSSDPSYTEKDFEFSGKADANGTYVGSYDMGITADQFKNINSRYTVEFIVETDGELKITPKPLTITAGSKEGVAPVTCDEWTATETAKGDTIVSVTITGIQPVPGESPNKASDAVIKNEAGVDVTNNYDITYVDGVLRAIEVLNKEEHFNYVIGYTDGTIRPGNNISRAEIATIFFRLLKDDVREKYMTTDCDFSDVASGAWCRRAIATLTNIGIIHGYTDGTFRPNAQITRAELATIIARFANLDVNTKTFSDITGHWAQKSIELAAGNGWINGYTDGTFRPNNKITRAETFAMINRVLDRMTKSVDDLLPQSDMNMWLDNMDESAWYYRDVQEATNYHKCDRVGDSIYEKWTAKIADIDWAVYQI